MNKEIERVLWEELDRVYENSAMLPKEWKNSASGTWIQTIGNIINGKVVY